MYFSLLYSYLLTQKQAYPYNREQLKETVNHLRKLHVFITLLTFLLKIQVIAACC